MYSFVDKLSVMGNSIYQWLISLLLFLIPLLSFSSSIDSLTYWKTNYDSIKTNLSKSELVDFNQRAYQLASDNNQEEHVLFFGTGLGNSLLYARKFKEAENILAPLDSLAIKLGNRNKQAELNSNLSYALRYQNKKREAIDILKKATILYNSIQQDSLAALAELNLGIVYKKLELTEYGLPHIISAIKVLEEYLPSKGLASAYDGKAGVHQINLESSQALEYFQKALAIRKVLDHQVGIAKSYNNLGYHYQELNMPDSALYYYEASIEINEKLNRFNSISNTLSNIGEVYLEQRNVKNAQTNLDRAFELAKKTNDHELLAEIAIQLAQLNVIENKPGKVNHYLTIGEDYAQKVNVPSVSLELIELQIQYAEKSKRFELLPPLLKTYTQLKDTIYSKEKAKVLLKYEVEYDVEKKRKENELLRANNRKKDAEAKANKAQKNFWIAMAAILVLGLIFILQRYFDKRKSNNQLNELLKEEQHRIKNFLQVIKSIFSMHEKDAKNTRVKEAIKEGHDRITSMMLLQNQLREPTLNNHGKIDFNHYIKELVEHICVAYEGHNSIISYDLDITDLEMDVNDATNVGLIMNEVVTNAFKYAVPFVSDPKVLIQTKKTPQGISIIVHDNGDGLDEDETDTFGSSQGMKFIQLFCQNLGTKPTFTNDNGLRFELHLKQ